MTSSRRPSTLMLRPFLSFEQDCCQKERKPQYTSVRSRTMDCLVFADEKLRASPVLSLPPPLSLEQVGGVPLTSLLVADDQEKLPTGQCRPRVPPTPINLRGDAYLSLQKVLANAQVREEKIGKNEVCGQRQESDRRRRCLWVGKGSLGLLA